MVKINEHYLKLKAGYLFPEIARRVQDFINKNPEAPIIKLGIGDVTQPLPEAVIKGGKEAFDDMGNAATFHGYGPEKGYAFLRETIADHDFKPRGVNVEADEIFVSDASKCDTGNIQEIFADTAKIAIQDPVYPVYVDTNVMAGRTGQADEKGRYEGLVYLESKVEKGFLPDLPSTPVDLIYLCFPNNPTGVVASREYLKTWVDYARKNQAVILFDAAYEAYITEEDIPHSIYEIEGARECAIEFRSFSKNAGFTGTRCAFTVVPKDIMGQTGQGKKTPLHALWSRRQSTKFNGVSYPIQKAAAACYTPEGQAQIEELVSYYLANAQIIYNALQQLGYAVYGGVNSPYIWLETPVGMGSWDFFDHLLQKTNVVGTPGAGFGACGEGFFRLSAFGSRENVEEAMERISKISM